MVASFLIRKVLDSLAYCAYSLFRFSHFLYLHTHQRDCRGGRRGWIIACLHRTCSGAEAEDLLPDVGTPHRDSASGRAVLFMPDRERSLRALEQSQALAGGGEHCNSNWGGIWNPKGGRGWEEDREIRIPVFPTCQVTLVEISFALK